MRLHHYLLESTRRFPDSVAVEEPTGLTISYRHLNSLSDGLAWWLSDAGVAPGDRVGLILRKSIDAVAAIFGVLKRGAIYVPVDPLGPPRRGAWILNDCAIKAAVVEAPFYDGLQAELALHGTHPQWLVIDSQGGRPRLGDVIGGSKRRPLPFESEPAKDDPAYILYTSGSTGKPKGVMLTHTNGTSFVEWCTRTFSPTSDDRFSSHAPFHFDLSIFDVFLSVASGATLVLIDDDLGKSPVLLGKFIAERRLTVWYSTPSILSLLTQLGKLERYDYSSLRLVLFAGEVFPVKHLRALKVLWPAPQYFNLYGPTETNVCTYYRIPERIPEDRVESYPIGRACSHVRTGIVDELGQPVEPGAVGELVVSGLGVMKGYWNQPEKTSQAFLERPPDERWYRTGDLVFEGVDGNYVFLGRRDRMVKRRGYRIELDEIETALYRHPSVKEAAVVAVPNPDSSTRIGAFLSWSGGGPPSVIELKRFCIDNLPGHMVPDDFVFVDSLPQTSTRKADYKELEARLLDRADR